MCLPHRALSVIQQSLRVRQGFLRIIRLQELKFQPQLRWYFGHSTPPSRCNPAKEPVLLLLVVWVEVLTDTGRGVQSPWVVFHHRNHHCVADGTQDSTHPSCRAASEVSGEHNKETDRRRANGELEDNHIHAHRTDRDCGPHWLFALLSPPTRAFRRKSGTVRPTLERTLGGPPGKKEGTSADVTFR